MGLFDLLKRRRGAQNILVAADELLGATITLLIPKILDRIKQWDLDNRYLCRLLGYIAGFLDSAYQSTEPSRFDERYVDKLFQSAVAKYLHEIPGVDVFVTISAKATDLGGSAIGGLQGVSDFIKGMAAGGNDFVQFVNEKRPPLTLSQLLDTSTH